MFNNGIQIRRLKEKGKYATSLKERQCECCSETAVIQIGFVKRHMTKGGYPRSKRKYIYLCENHKNNLAEYFPYFK